MEALIGTFGIDWHLIVVQMVNFVLVVVVLTYFLYRPLIRAVDARTKKIAAGIRDAEAALKTKEEIESTRTGILAEAHHAGTLITARAEEQAQKERSELVHAAEVQARHIRDDAARAAEEDVRKLKAAAETELAKSAVLAAEKILRTRG